MAEQMRASPLVPARIPRYISNLNALAVNAGLAVEVEADRYRDDPQIRPFSKWRGAQGAFLALVQPVASYHLPLSCGRLNIPGGTSYYAPNALISGDVFVTGSDVLFEIDFGSVEFSVSDAAGVEIVSYVDETLYHGAPAALMTFGIERSRLPLQKKGAKSNRDWSAQTEDWASRRQPDGSIVYRVESPSALRRRRAEVAESAYVARVRATPAERETQIKARPSHLRLLIDNTRNSKETPRGER